MLDNSKYQKRFIGLVMLVAVLVCISLVCQSISLANLHKRLDEMSDEMHTLNDKLDEVVLGSGELLRLQEIQEEEQVFKIELQDHDALRDTVKRLSYSEDISRAGKGMHKDIPLKDIEFSEYLGEFRLSFYTPCTEECGSNSGITSSGKPVVGGYTVAADTSCWPYGTRFYIEGFGVVEVMDTGGAIKGGNRLDICLVTDRSKAMHMGIQYRDVWLIN